MVQHIDGNQFAAMFLSAAAAIEASRQRINELNVFPVPDGDTGTNMSLTMATAVAELQKKPNPHIGLTADTVAQGLLRGARGNSGVILSLLFRGFAKSARECATLSGTGLAAALREGVDAAYRAVMKPAEGTILTVSSQAAKRALAAASEDTAFEFVLSEALIAAELALEETVRQNPVLAKAGVIDAGGQGYCVILEGMLLALRGKPFVADGDAGSPRREQADFSEYTEEDIHFCYCTEFIILRESDRDAMKLNAYLGSIGDSLVLVDDERIIKVHVHTNNPGAALEEALTYGQLTAVKIENMREQHSQKVIEIPPEKETSRVVAKPTRRFGFVAVCSGAGISGVFRDLGVDGIISGGQTMNPSTEDILRVIDATPSDIVFVLPNNKNIIMAAEQCIPLSEKEVIVLPTRSAPQGMSAMLVFDPSLDAGQNREAMLSALAGVTTGEVTYAARESVFDGQTIHEGDHMALLNNRLLYTHREASAVHTRLADEIASGSPSFVTVFYGEGVSEAEAEAMFSLVRRHCPGAEVNLINGGQPVYSYLISAE
ncbi:MAG: DAK2 domain-containing protein [Oscillospiraceae bacterium]|nr:DAK2 domain-containing protein [Oscillospiraceae bacterium]